MARIKLQKYDTAINDLNYRIKILRANQQGLEYELRLLFKLIDKKLLLIKKIIHWRVSNV